MKKKKVFAVIISFALILAMALPGTLAVSADQDTSDSEFTATNEPVTSTPEPETTPEETPTPEDEGEAAPTPEASSEATPAAENDLFDRLMACETLEAVFALIDETPEEELMQLSESQIVEVEAKIAALEPEPLPAVVIEESNDEPVVSEIIYPTVNFDDVAPLGDPVVGGEG